MALLVRAKALSAPPPPAPPPSSEAAPYAHRFEKYNYATPSYCEHCSSLLWNPVKAGLKCVDCGFNCHEKCVDAVGGSCTRFRTTPATHPHHHTTPPHSNHDTQSVASGAASQKASAQSYADYSSNVPENRTHEGYLWKRGALLKNWKLRWFVLDSVKHELRYYDSSDDPQAKGVIDMSEVVAVVPAQPSQGAPKRVQERAFFDLHTKKRLYNFIAWDASAAQDWIEKIGGCLQ